MSTQKQTTRRKKQLTGNKLAAFLELMINAVQDVPTIKGTITDSEAYQRMVFTFPEGIEDYRKIEIKFIN